MNEVQLLPMCLLTVYIFELLVRIREGKELSQHVASPGVQLQPDLTACSGPCITPQSETHHEAKGVCSFILPGSQSLVRAEDDRWVSFLLRWLLLTWGQLSETFSCSGLISSQHSLQLEDGYPTNGDPGMAATASPAVSKHISPCWPQLQPLKNTWYFLNMPSTSTIPGVSWNKLSTLSSSLRPTQPLMQPKTFLFFESSLSPQFRMY